MWGFFIGVNQMKEIKLTQGQVALVDDEDFERLNQYKWCIAFNGSNWYAARTVSIGNGNQKKVLMHREIMNAPKGVQVDHKNGDGLFNCKENLRFCTNQQNQFNQKNARKNNKLGIKGTSWNKKLKKFRARIGINRKDIH